MIIDFLINVALNLLYAIPISIFLLSIPYLKGLRFLAKTLYEGNILDHFRALPRLISIFQADSMAFFQSGDRRFKASRLLAEIEILQTPSPKPSKYDFDMRSDFEHALEEWKRESSTRRRDNKAKLKSLVADAEDFLELKIANPSDLDEIRGRITRYFRVLKKFGRDDAFVAHVKLEKGYLAPIFLIAGLLARFDQDWQVVINNYRDRTATDKIYSLELVELRSFLFNCWLLWGPSVPLCRCDQWRLKDVGPGQDSLPLAYQYGFGDENNSIDVLVLDGQGVDFQSNMRKLLRQHGDAAQRGAGQPVAINAVPFSVRGKIKWGPLLPDKNICKAQNAIQGGSKDKRDPSRGRVVLQYTDGERTLTSEVSRYYSAYLWIMFIVTDRDGRPFFTDKPWRNLMPFFEHGNIADATTYQTLKETLVAKICSTMREILFRDHDRNIGLSLSYACAFDHSNCGGEECDMYPPAEIEFAPSEAVTTRRRKARLLEILHQTILGDTILAKALADGRIILPLAPTPHRLDGIYSSCHLSELIEDFYADLRQASEVRGERRPAIT